MRHRRLIVLVLLALVVWGWWARAADLSIGTFNIRVFPGPETDVAAVVDALAELDADAFTVQEIVGVAEFHAALRAAGERTRRDWRAALVPYCRPDFLRPIYLGVVYDARRLTLRTSRALEPGLGCDDDQPHGMVAVLGGAGGPDFGLASVHLKAGGQAADLAIRRRQWAWLIAALPELEEELAAPIVVAGDVNSTGYRDGDERRFIDETVRAAGRTLATADLACSMYWQPKPGEQRWVGSLLDHVLAPSTLAVEDAEALGMCARLACADHDGAPPEWRTVSDHCPIRASLRR